MDCKKGKNANFLFQSCAPSTMRFNDFFLHCGGRWFLLYCLWTTPHEYCYRDRNPFFPNLQPNCTNPFFSLVWDARTFLHQLCGLSGIQKILDTLCAEVFLCSLMMHLCSLHWLLQQSGLSLFHIRLENLEAKEENTNPSCSTNSEESHYFWKFLATSDRIFLSLLKTGYCIRKSGGLLPIFS